MIPSELIPGCAAPQVYVDLETPSQLWDELRVGVEEYLGSHPEYYSGNCAVFCFGASDPLKLQLGVFFEYSFNGGALSTRRVTGWFGAREKTKTKNKVVGCWASSPKGSFNGGALSAHFGMTTMQTLNMCVHTTGASRIWMP